MPAQVLLIDDRSFIVDLDKNCNNGVHLVLAGIAVKEPGMVVRRPVICRKLDFDVTPWVVWWQCYEKTETYGTISDRDASYMHQGSYCTTLGEALKEFNRRMEQITSRLPLDKDGVWVKR